MVKATAHLVPMYEKRAKDENSRQHYRMMVDTLVWQYVPDVIELMRSKGASLDGLPSAHSII